MSAYRVLPAQRVLPASRVITATRTISTKPVVALYTVAEAGETFIPHLYDLFFDGIDDYVVVGIQPDGRGTPFEVYGWSGITFVDYAMPVRPKYNAAWSKTNMVGRYGSPDWASWFLFAPNNMQFYTSIVTHFVTRRPDGASRIYDVVITDRVNVFSLYTSAFSLSTRFHEVYVDSSRRGSFTIPSNEVTILEQDPSTAGMPVAYRRYVIGANTTFGELMTMYISCSMVFSRALPPSELISTHPHFFVPNASGLRLFLDPTFFDGSKYLDLSGNNNHGIPYGGVSRVQASRTWMYRVRGLYSGDRVRVLVPPMCRYRVGRGEWQVNSTWSTLELFLDPGWVSVVIEAL